MRTCMTLLLFALLAAVSGCQTTGGDSASDHEANQKVGANAD